MKGLTKLRIKPLENIVEESENQKKWQLPAFSPFPTMFSTLSKMDSIVWVTSTANSFNLIPNNKFEALPISKLCKGKIEIS